MDAFKNRRAISGNPEIESLMKLAEAIAEGQTPTLAYSTNYHAPKATGGGDLLKFQEINAKLDRCIQRADEALHRSELALQQARQSSTLHEAPVRSVAQRDSGAEVERIGEIVKRLSKEVSELRLDVKKGQIDSALRQSEMKHLAGQRMRARISPSVERLGSEIERDIADDRQAVTKPTGHGRLMFSLSILFGGAIAVALLMLILFFA
jgi:hypothetical protein